LYLILSALGWYGHRRRLRDIGVGVDLHLHLEGGDVLTNGV